MPASVLRKLSESTHPRSTFTLCRHRENNPIPTPFELPSALMQATILPLTARSNHSEGHAGTSLTRDTELNLNGSLVHS